MNFFVRFQTPAWRTLSLLLLLIAGAGLELCAQAWGFDYQAGIGSNDAMMGVVSDAQGNLYGAGHFRGNVNFGAGYSLNSANSDALVTKHAADGSLLWAVQAGSPSIDQAYDIARDANGFLYITGFFNQTISFATSGAPITLTSSGQEDIFIAKLDPQNGQTLWAVRAGGSAGEAGHGITVMGSGVYVTGEFKGNSSFGTTTLNSYGGVDAFVTRVDTGNGGFQWATSGRCSGDEFGYDISHDGSNVYFAGSFGGGTFVLGGDTLINSGTRDIYLCKLNPAGGMVWIRQGGTAAGDDAAYAIAASGGKVYVGGMANTGLIAFLDDNVTGIVGFSIGGGTNAVLCRYNAASGAPEWLTVAGFGGQDAYTDIAVNSLGNLLVAGYFQDSIRFNGTSYLGSGQDALVTEVQPSNSVVQVWTTTGNGDAAALGVAATTCGFVACGDFSASLVIPLLPTLTSNGQRDMWLAGGLPSNTYLALATASDDSICLGNPVTLSVSPASLTNVQWQSGPSASGPWTNIPAATGLNHTLQPAATAWYRATSPNACTGASNAVSVTVEATLLSFTPITANYCADHPVLNLSGSAAPAGTFGSSTTGLFNVGGGAATFDPSLASTGPAYIFYTAPGHCVVPDTQFFVIDTLPVVSISGLAPSYCSSAPVALATSSHLGLGTFSSVPAAGLTDLGNGTATFAPALATPGTAYLVTYSLTDGNGCSASVTASTQVTTSRTYTLTSAPTSACANAAPIAVSGSTTPAGVFGGSFPAISPTGPGTASLAPSGVAPGAYTLTYADAGACVIGDTVTVTVDSVPVLGLSGLAPTYCSTVPALLVSGNLPGLGTFTSVPAAGLTDLGNGTATFDPAAATPGIPYLVSYNFTDGNGCSSTAAASTLVSAPSSYGITSAPANVCANSAPFAVSGTTTPAGVFGGSFPGISPTGPGTASLDPSGVAPGTYTLIYADAGACVSGDTIALTVDSVPVISLSGLAASYCSSTPAVLLSGNMPGLGTFTSVPAAGLTDLGNGTASFDPAAATPGTAYLVSYNFTDGNGCSNSAAASTQVSTTRSYAITSAPSSVCANAAPFPVTGTTSPAGVFGGSFPAISATGSGTASLDPSGVAPGIYSLTYADAGACVIGDTVTITVDSVPVVTLSGLLPNYCASGSPDTLLGSAAPGGSFSSATAGLADLGNGTAAFDPAAATAGGPYSLLYSFTDAQGCTGSATFDVVVTPDTLLSIQNLQASYCLDHPIVLLTGNYAPLGSFSASAPGLNDQGNGTATFDPSQAGSGPVTILYNLTGNCVTPDTQSTDINLLPLVTLSPTQPGYCGSDTAFLLLGNQAPGGAFTASPAAGLFDNGNGTATFTPGAASTGTPYAVIYTYTDSQGCQGSDTATFSVASASSYLIDPLPASICANDIPLVVLGSLTPVGLFTAIPATGVTNIGNGAAVVDPSLASPGLLTLIYGDTVACAVSDTVSLLIHPSPTAVLLGLDAQYCGNAPADSLVGNFAPAGSISANVTLLNASQGAALLDPSLVAPGSGYWVTYSYTDANGCMDADSAQFEVLPGLDYQLPSLTNTLCDNGVPLGIVGNQAPLGTFAGSSPGVTDLGNGQASIDPLLYGGQNLWVVYGDSSACSNADSHLVFIIATPTVNLSGLAPDYCTGAPIDTILASPAGGTFSPAISGLNIIGPGSATFNPSLAPLGQPLMLYYAYSANGCQTVDSLTFVVYDQPAVQLGGDLSLCAGDSASIGTLANPNHSYSWTAIPGGAFSGTSQVTVLPLATTTYVLAALHGTCSAADTLVVNVQAPPIVDAGPDLDICLGDSFAAVGNSSSIPVLWTNANGNLVGSDLVLEAIAGTSPWYVLSAVAQGCIGSDTLRVQTSPPPSPAQTGGDIQAIGIQPVTLSAAAPSLGVGVWSATGGLSFSDPLDPGAVVSGLSNGLNILVWTVSSSPACPSSADTLYIEVGQQRIPTGFSPNGDGLNDNFELEGLVPGTQLLVFNRWGNEVYADANYQNDWGGNNTSGQALGDDTYYCVLRFPDDSSYAGFVVLKR